MNNSEAEEEVIKLAANKSEQSRQVVINTGGGAYVDGNVSIRDGDFWGRDKNVSHLGQKPEDVSPAFRILTVTARPLDDPDLPDIADTWSLTDGLRAVQAPVEISFLRPPTRERLELALDNDWDVLHFDGRGVEAAGGGLFFETEEGLRQFVSIDDFIALLKRIAYPPKLVIISACPSAQGDGDGLVGRLEREAAVASVIGFRETPPVEMTMAFVARLYAALGAGRTIADSFNSARDFLGTFPSITLPPNNAGEAVRKIAAGDLPVLTGSNIDQALCPGGRTGWALVERGPLMGAPAPSESGHFYGIFQAGDPPMGRKGLLVRATRALLDGEKMVVLRGQGGIGKSALAAVLARRLAWRYPGGVFWVDGAAYQQSGLGLDEVLNVFAAYFGDDFIKTNTAQKRQAVLAYLGQVDTPCLWIIDNAEVAGDAVWQLARQVGGRSAVLLTSREKPKRGGWLLDVEGIAIKEALPFLEQEVRRRKGDLLWGLALNEIQIHQLREIARLVDGHALALLHAAALIADEGLGQAEKLVRANPARGEVSQRFDFSYTRLTTVETVLLQRLAAFAADFDAHAVEAVCTTVLDEQDDGLIPSWDDALRELARKSFVETIRWGEDYRRYRLHPVLREYVRAKAGNSLTRDEWRMARFYLGMARAARDLLGDIENARAAVAMVESERPNLLAAQQICLEQGRETAVISFAYRLDHLFERSGRWDARRSALETGLRATEKTSGQDHATLLHDLGRLMQDTGDYAQARHLYQQSLEINQQLGNRMGVAYTLGQLGILAYLAINYEEAGGFYNRVLEISRALEDQRSVGRSLHQLGLLADAQGEYVEAHDLYVESLGIAQQLGDKEALASSLHQLGNLAYQQGNDADARRLYSDSLDISRQLEDKTGLAQSLYQLGMLGQKAGDYTEARRLYQESLEIRQLLGDKVGAARNLYQLGLLAEAEGDLKNALELMCQAGKTLSALSSPDEKIVAQNCERIEKAIREKRNE